MTLAILMTMHPKMQSPEYRTFRVSMFVATGLSGVAPLVHGLNMFGMSQMMRKALPHTLAKAACLLSGTSFYVVSLPTSQLRENMILTHVILRPGFPKVDIQANSTYGAPIRFFISWWSVLLWSSRWDIWLPSIMLRRILLARLLELCKYAEYGVSRYWDDLPNPDYTIAKRTTWSGHC